MITSNHIDNWANRIDSRNRLPVLIRRLIHSTIDHKNINRIVFPGSEDINLSGYDGELITQESNSFIPLGISVWEMSNNQNIETNANYNYDKRVDNSLSVSPNETVFIFVTARKWSGKEKWAEDKTSQGIWKEVRAYDATDIELWLEMAPAVLHWFASEIGHSIEGVKALENYVSDWLSTTEPIIPDSDLALSGRNNQITQLTEWFRSNKQQVILKSLTIDEVVLFIDAATRSLPQTERDSIRSRTLIIDDIQTLNRVSMDKSNAVFFVPIFLNVGDISFKAGHRYIIPIDRSNVSSECDIDIPRIDKRDIKKCLVQLGLSEQEAQLTAKNSGRSISLLRYLLSNSRSNPKWMHLVPVRDLIPMALVQVWLVEKKGDNEVIQLLGGGTREDYETKLKSIFYLADSPIFNIDSQWRLESPLTLWWIIIEHLTESDLKEFKNIVVNVFKAIDPILRDNCRSSLLFSETKYSAELRKGLAQTLVIISLNALKGKQNNNTFQQFVDQIVSDLLKEADVYLWLSVEDVMPLLAEASPEEFINAVEDSLNSNTKSLLQIFSEEINPSKSLPGLLWALEGIAWDEQYLCRVALVLAHLASADPGGTVGNRPINSLKDIFRLWMPQTNANIDCRFEIIELIIQKFPNVGWELLVSLLPERRSFGKYNHKFIWRDIEYPSDEAVSLRDYYSNTKLVVDKVLNIVDYDSFKWSVFIKSIQCLPQDICDTVLSELANRVDLIDCSQLHLWNTIREILNRHRTYSKYSWVMPEGTLEKLDSIYKALEPEDVRVKYKHLYDDHFPKLGVGWESKSDEEINKILIKARSEVVNEIISRYTLKGLLDYAKSLEYPELLSVGLSTDDVKNSIDLIHTNLDNEDKKVVLFCQSAILRTIADCGIEWGFQLLIDTIKDNHTTNRIVNLSLCLPAGNRLWIIVDGLANPIRKGYWAKCQFSSFELSEDEIQYALEKLLAVKRYNTVLLHAYINRKRLMIDTIFDVLFKINSIENIESTVHIDSYKIEQLIGIVSNDPTVDIEVKTSLELLNLHILTSSYCELKPKYLFYEMSSNPESFLSVIKLLDKPKGVEHLDESGMSEDELKKRELAAKNAWSLLNNWKMIPGSDDTGKIDYLALKEWIEKLIELASKEGYEEVCRSYIGKILSYSPTNDTGQWPVDEVCEILEVHNDDIVSTGFIREKRNQRRTTGRGCFEGGQQERDLANKYTELAKKIRNKYSHTSKILNDIAENYKDQANREDIRAEKMKLDY